MKSIVFSKYKKIPLSIKATIWYILGTVLVKGINFLIVPIFSRVLTIEQFGLYSLYNSWAQIISILVTMNLSYGVYVRGMTKFEKDKDLYTSSMQLLTILLAAVWFISVIVFNEFVSIYTNIKYSFFLLMIIQSLMMSGHSFWSTRNKFEMNYKTFTYVSVIIGLGIPLSKLASLIIPNVDNGVAVIVAQVIFQFVFGLVFIIKNFKNTKFRLKKITSYWLFAIKFNLPLVPYYISQILLDQMDKLMIASILTQSEVALYNIPYQVSMILTVIASSIGNSLIPMIHKSLNENKLEELRKNIHKVLLILFLFSSFLNLLAPELIWIMAPPEYSDAVWLVSPIVAGMFFKFLTTIFNNIEFYYELSSISLVASVVAIIFNGVLNYYFIPLFGITAAAYTTLFSFLLSCVIHILILKHKKITKAYSEGSIFVFSSATIIVSFFSKYLYDLMVLRLSIVGLLVILLFRFNKQIFKF